MEREMHEEMVAHIAPPPERFLARGMSERDARAAARREFGNVGLMQEVAREARGGQWLDNLLTDLRYAFRYFARTLASIGLYAVLNITVGQRRREIGIAVVVTIAVIAVTSLASWLPPGEPHAWTG